MQNNNIDNDIELKAIKEVLDKLYNEAKYAFHHDCERCGEMYKEKNSCNVCKQKDKELLEIKIPKWEQKLKNIEAKYNAE